MDRDEYLEIMKPACELCGKIILPGEMILRVRLVGGPPSFMHMQCREQRDFNRLFHDPGAEL
jgi:hypothetical protein